MTTYRLAASFTALPLTLNQRINRWEKAKRVAAVRSEAAWRCRAAHIPATDWCRVCMIWTVPDRRRRDAENPILTMKAWCDGIVDAGVVPDDVPEMMDKLMPKIRYERGVSRVEFTVEVRP